MKQNQQSRRVVRAILKVVVGMFLVLVLGLFGFFVALRLMASSEKSHVPEMTQERAQTMFCKAGGTDEISREAKNLLEQTWANGWTFLDDRDLTNAPAILLLYSTCKTYSGRDYSGTSVAIFPEDGRHIEIKFGNHWSLKRFYIFNPNAPVTFIPPPNWFQVTSNIFASK